MYDAVSTGALVLELHQLHSIANDAALTAKYSQSELRCRCRLVKTQFGSESLRDMVVVEREPRSTAGKRAIKRVTFKDAVFEFAPLQPTNENLCLTIHADVPDAALVRLFDGISSSLVVRSIHSVSVGSDNLTPDYAGLCASIASALTESAFHAEPFLIAVKVVPMLVVVHESAVLHTSTQQHHSEGESCSKSSRIVLISMHPP
jgi:hypothetical protein